MKPSKYRTPPVRFSGLRFGRTGNVGSGNVGNDNTGYGNVGSGNTGHGNSGNGNVGDGNTPYTSAIPYGSSGYGVGPDAP